MLLVWKMSDETSQVFIMFADDQIRYYKYLYQMSNLDSTKEEKAECWNQIPRGEALPRRDTTQRLLASALQYRQRNGHKAPRWVAVAQSRRCAIACFGAGDI